MVHLISEVKLKWVWKSTGGRVSQHATKRTCSFLHQQQERMRSIQSKCSLLNENGFLFRASKSVFQACEVFTSCQRFLGTETFWIYFIFCFYLFIFFFFFFFNLSVFLSYVSYEEKLMNVPTFIWILYLILWWSDVVMIPVVYQCFSWSFFILTRSPIFSDLSVLAPCFPR